MRDLGPAWDKLQERWSEGKALCVGLDTDHERLPPKFRSLPSIADGIFGFNQAIVEVTSDLVCAYKPNSAFYEQYGAPGVDALRQTIQYIRKHHPGITVILDAKRGDIGSTTEGYAKAAFDFLNAHAITVSPYLGREALAPMLDRTDRGVFVLAKTSNPGAGEFQDLLFEPEKRPLYEVVARQVAETWNGHGNCGVVVGATYPADLKRVRDAVGDLPILVPGLGTQGGDVERMTIAGVDSRGRGIVANASRSVLFAESHDNDFAAAARAEAEKLANRLLLTPSERSP